VHFSHMTVIGTRSTNIMQQHLILKHIPIQL
jgi:hypothetical protein